MRPVDSHCHLSFEQFETDREEIIQKTSSELKFIVNAGTGPKNNEKVVKLREKHPEFVKINLGLHPVYTDSFSEIDKVKKQVRRNDPSAVGEIGLDHHHIDEEGLRDEQEQVFREMLELAEELSKPVAVHSRDAEEQAVNIISEYDVEAFLHCFNGTVSLAERAVEEGGLIGVTTQVLYSSRVQEIVENIGLENILLETDSPYLYRGERNEPVNVKESAEKIAEIKDVSTQEVIQITTSNAEKFFE